MHSHTRYSKASWKGGLKKGTGIIEVESGTLRSSFNLKSRLSKNKPSSNPEELLCAALSESYIMQFSSILDRNDTPATELEVKTELTLSSGMSGPSINFVNVNVNGYVPKLTKEQFEQLAEKTLKKCPVSELFTPYKNIKINANLKKLEVS